MNAVRVNAKSVAKENTMKTSIPKLRRMIRKVISESNYGYGGHEGGSMVGHIGRGSDMPLPKPTDTRIVHWRDFKEAVEAGDYDEAREFLSEIGCDDPMDQDAWLGDGIELTADELAREWSYQLEQM